MNYWPVPSREVVSSLKKFIQEKLVPEGFKSEATTLSEALEKLAAKLDFLPLTGGFILTAPLYRSTPGHRPKDSSARIPFFPKLRYPHH